MIEILEVSGEGDFSVINWENSGLSFDEIVRLARKSEDGEYTHPGDDGFTAEIIPFDFEDSPKNREAIKEFIDYVKDTYCDYDSLKDRDFFLIEGKNNG